MRFLLAGLIGVAVTVVLLAFGSVVTPGSDDSVEEEPVWLYDVDLIEAREPSSVFDTWDGAGDWPVSFSSGPHCWVPNRERGREECLRELEAHRSEWQRRNDEAAVGLDLAYGLTPGCVIPPDSYCDGLD